MTRRRWFLLAAVASGVSGLFGVRAWLDDSVSETAVTISTIQGDSDGQSSRYTVFVYTGDGDYDFSLPESGGLEPISADVYMLRFDELDCVEGDDIDPSTVAPRTAVTFARSQDVGFSSPLALRAVSDVKADCSVVLPPPIDASSLLGSQSGVPISEVVGLPEFQVREWADESGFQVVARSDEDHTGDLRPSERLILTVDGLGIVTSAIAA